MPLPVIADVFRIATTWGGATAAGVNVHHVHAPGKTASQVATAWAAAFESVNNVHNPWNAMSNIYTATSFILTPLDGVTAGQPFAYTHTQQGGGTASAIPAVAAVVSLQTAQRGSRGRGRTYVGPADESTTQGGQVLTTIITDMLLAWGAILTSLSSAGASLCIASYTHADQHHVTTVRVDTPTGTQRRRQDRFAGR